MTVPEDEHQAPRPGAFRALRHRNFRLYWTGQLISLIGTWMQNLAQGWLIVLLVDPVTRTLLRHGGTAVGGHAHAAGPAVEASANLYSGWVNFASGFPIFALTLFAGVVADRVRKRRMLLTTQTLLVCTAATLGVLCLTGRVTMWHVLAISAISGCVIAFDLPARQSFLVELVPREDLPSAIALNSAIFNGARSLGPAVAGILLAANISIGTAFMANACLTLAAVLAIFLLKLPDRKADNESDNGRINLVANMVAGFQYVRTTPTVFNLVFLVATFGLFALSFNVLIPTFIKFTLLPHEPDRYQVKAFGLMETVRGVGALAGALTVAVLGGPARQRNMLIVGSVMSTTLLIAFSLSRNITVAYCLMAMIAYGLVVCFATSNTLMQLTVPDALRGRVMSIYTLMFIGTAPFGSLVAGGIAQHVGAPRTILALAVVSLASLVFTILRPRGLLTLTQQSPST